MGSDELAPRAGYALTATTLFKVSGTLKSGDTRKRLAAWPEH